ncbi:hypothetical protein G7Y89_g15111 [Cudoniella acicularis]|uniref:F-box domain-containing protein n=1 Tax=Cudoniella acicularis TaxID=354080 RepID=A0A8H4VP15_9HELO|nr:hypothetical protein G7Y89_g15111 [Cudoniella acicularis]
MVDYCVSSVSLETMPDEVLWIIINDVSQPDVGSVSRANKRFHAFAKPLLYRKIQWVWSQDYTPPILLLLRTVLQRPDLAAQVQHVDFGSESHFDASAIPITRHEVVSLNQIVERAKFPNRYGWGIGIYAGSIVLEKYRIPWTDASIGRL